MRISRLFLNQLLQPALTDGTPVLAEGDRGHYLRNVLRLKVGDEVDLFNGLGGEYRGIVVDAGKKGVQIELSAFNPKDRTPEVEISLGLCIIKRDAMDTAIQKVTELGVKSIYPLVSEYVSVSGKQYGSRQSHWQSVAISACEQCGMNRIPEIAEPQSLPDWLKQQDGRKLYGRPGGERFYQSDHPQASHLSLLVGPEGGFSTAEDGAIQASGFVGVDLGNRILRAETAAISLMTLATYPA